MARSQCPLPSRHCAARPNPFQSVVFCPQLNQRKHHEHPNRKHQSPHSRNSRSRQQGGDQFLTELDGGQFAVMVAEALSIVPISQLSFLNRNGQPTNGN